ncbi:MAG: hypothetical protein D6738_08590 [Acidobacteria bacterium]|nr:MAG: hypothetical protein D6738_08590 [Acidobacteriota bacterium]
MEGTLPERAAAVLRADSTRSLCDDCLALLAGIKQRQTAHTIASSFGLTSDFVREQGVCSRCGDTKLVTRAAR